MLDTWRVAAGTVTTTVFDPAALRFADIVRAQTPRELHRIYAGCAEATAVLGAHAIAYIVVGPQEREALAVNEAFLRQFQLAGETDGYRLLRVNPQ